MTVPNAAVPPGEPASELYFGNNGLFTVLWPDGRVIFFGDGPGEIRPDGSLVMKFPWWRGPGVQGNLELEGRRLDGQVPALSSEIPQGYGDTGFQASAIVFPESGCWENTARAGSAELIVVQLVVVEEQGSRDRLTNT